jgi:anti-sigma factor ChrR (cupin superfamily)
MHQVRLPGLVPLDPARLPWRPTKVAGVAWIPLFLEGESGPRAEGPAAGSAVLIRMDPGCGYPRHAHVGAEEVLCLAGGYEDELGTVRAGDFVRYEAGSAHAPVALSGGPCVLFATARDGIRFEPG